MKKYFPIYSEYFYILEYFSKIFLDTKLGLYVSNGNLDSESLFIIESFTNFLELYNSNQLLHINKNLSFLDFDLFFSDEDTSAELFNSITSSETKQFLEDFNLMLSENFL